MEYLFIEVSCHTQKMLLGCVYRPHKRIEFKQLIKTLETESIKYTYILITGDLNSNILIETKLTDAMKPIDITPINTSAPTYFTTTSSTLLDLILVNNRDKVKHYDQLSAPMFLKHDLLFVNYNVQPKIKKQYFTYRDFNNINMNEYTICLILMIYYMPNIDDKIAFLEQNILNLYNKYVPTKRRSIKNRHNPWFSNEIDTLIHERDSAYARWKRYKMSELHIKINSTLQLVAKKNLE